MALKTVGFDSSSSSVYSPQKDVLESAAKMVNHHMQLDDSFSELVDCLKMGGELPKVSGLNNEDYPGLSELGFDFQPYTQLSVVKKIPLPPELVEQFGFLQTNCQMGLFPQIGRAWLTIDSNIFLWSFHDGSDLAYYDGIENLIMCVGLVKPKPGVFQNFIHYLLCLATPVEIVLLGVSFSCQHENSPPFEEMHLLPEPLFSFPTDDTVMSCFEGTDNGRIFFGGNDGCVYEFTYQATEGWFRRKFRKINHSSSTLSVLVPAFLQFALSEDDGIEQIVVDNSRNILYARTENGSIQVFDLGEDGNQMSRVTILHHQSILNKADAVAGNVDKKIFSPVVNICVVEATESRVVNLIAVTKAGVRLYFTTNVDSGSSRPCTLALLHVRLPPGFSANAVVDKLSNVHTSIYKKGFVMMAASIVDDHILFAACNDLFVFHKYLIETYTAMKLDGHTWAISEVPVNYFLKPIVPTGTSQSSATDPPLLITQHLELPRQFVILSDQGCCILSKPRPVDQLCKLLIENKGPDCDAVRSFFKLFTNSQACAMCLILICCRNVQDKQISEWATRAFFMYGGNPCFSVQVHESPASVDPQLSTTHPLSTSLPVLSSTPAPNQQNFHGSVPPPHFSTMYSPVRSVFSTTQSPLHASSPVPPDHHQQQFTSDGSSFASNAELHYSGKHDGLNLYFSRIIRPLWNMKLICEKERNPPDSGSPYLCSSISSEDLTHFIRELSALKDFIQSYHPYFGNSSNTSSFSRQTFAQSPSPTHDVASLHPHLQNKAQSDAELQERTSILNLQLLVSYTCEVLGLWKVLCDHQFESIATLLSVTDQEQLKQITFKEFIVDGKDLCTALTTAVINFYLDDNASTSAISERLRDVCPSIFRTEDATVSKAHEIVLSVKSTINKAEKEKRLLEALKLCKSVCPNINLKAMCLLFYENRFYHGLVDLSVCMAQRLDPQCLALHYYRNGEPPNDLQGQQAYSERMECYKVVTDTVSELVSISLSHPTSPCIPVSSGPQPPQPSCHLTPEEAKHDSELLFEMALKTDDEVFHSAIYDWLIATDQTNALLSIKSHFLENYLKRRTSMQPDSQQSLDLLWKFYEKNNNFSAAARVLAKLADKHGIDLSLSQRLEYLSRAIISIKSSEMRVSATGEGEFLHELEEKMEVARIQLQILQALEQKKISGLQEALLKLNSNFLDITQLYEEFAVPYDLPENKLAIVHCAGHYDPSLIESLWQSIIDKELVATCGNIPDTRVKILHHKLQTIIRMYVASEKYFPVAFIIEYLEFKTCTMNLNLDWVYQIMLSVGLSLKELLNIYHKMYRSKDSSWHNAKKPIHLLQVLSLLIGEFVKNPSLVPQSERRSYVTLSLDVIAGYLVDLQAMSMMNPIVPDLMKEFKAVQHKLERLL